MTEDTTWIWLAGLFALWALAWYVGKALAERQRRRDRSVT